MNGARFPWQLDIQQERKHGAVRRVAVAPSLVTCIPELAVLLELGDEMTLEVASSANADLYLDCGPEGDASGLAQRAKTEGKPLLHVEPGLLPPVLIRGDNIATHLAITIDDLGSRWDAGRLKRFEKLVIELAASDFDRTEAEELRRALMLPPPFREYVPPGAREAKRIVIIDEEAKFSTPELQSNCRAMLEAAVRENPGAILLLMPASANPDDGILAPKAAAHGLSVLFPTVDCAELALHVSRAYTVASDTAWQFLVAEVPVRCFGTPFYSGWGLTEDEQKNPRRAAVKADLTTLIEVCMIRLARYRNPFTGRAIRAREALEIVRDIQRMVRRNADIGGFYNFMAWKRDTIARMFAGPDNRKSFSRILFRAIGFAKRSNKALVAWASDTRPAVISRIRASGIPLLPMEDGFIRSVGLGASGYQPLSLVLDDRGIYYDCHKPSRLEAILSDARFDDQLIARARALIETLRAANITKYNLTEKRDEFAIHPGKKVIFVPGQVEDDASILLGANGMRAIEQLSIIRRHNPDAYVIYKPHPDVSAGLRKGLADARKVLVFADLYLENQSVLRLVDIADEVHTITSLTGFEALLRSKPVTCYGKPFYAGWGLTTDIAPVTRRQRKLRLEELVAGALILYPHYLDPITGLLSTPEIAIQRIVDYRTIPARPDAIMQIRSWLKHWLRQLGR